MPDVILLTPMLHGFEDGSTLRLEPGSSLTIGKEAGERDGKPVFTEDQVKELIRGGAAFDRSGELDVSYPAFVDTETLKRDAAILEAGGLIHVDASNPLENAQQMKMKDNPASLERQAAVENIKASPDVKTPEVIVKEDQAKVEAATAEAKAKAAKPSQTTQTAQNNPK